jgi:hypothetical protein
MTQTGYRIVQVEADQRNWMRAPQRIYADKGAAERVAAVFATMSIGEHYEVEFWNEIPRDRTSCDHQWVDWQTGPMGFGKTFWECSKCGARK